jgi:hypothetical protein
MLSLVVFIFYFKADFFSSCPGDCSWVCGATKASVASRVEPHAHEQFGSSPDPIAPLIHMNAFALSSLSAFLAPARTKPMSPRKGHRQRAQARAYPWTGFGLSVTQPERRAPRDPNSNRCLSGGSGRKLACIRMSQNTFTST